MSTSTSFFNKTKDRYLLMNKGCILASFSLEEGFISEGFSNTRVIDVNLNTT